MALTQMLFYRVIKCSENFQLGKSFSFLIPKTPGSASFSTVLVIKSSRKIFKTPGIFPLLKLTKLLERRAFNNSTVLMSIQNVEI